MKLHRTAVIATAAGAVVAAAVALVAGQRSLSSETFPDGFDAGVNHTLRGSTLERYRGEGGPGGPLGLPISEETPTTYQPMTSRGADRQVGFRHGAIYLNSRTGETWFGVWFAYTPPEPQPEH